MGILKSAAGMVEVELISANPAASLQEITQQNIPVYQVRPEGELTMVFSISRKDYPILKKQAENSPETKKLTFLLGFSYGRTKEQSVVKKLKIF